MLIFITNLKVKVKLALLVSLFLAGFIVFGLLSKNTLDTVKVNGPIYQSIVLGKDLVADILPLLPTS